MGLEHWMHYISDVLVWFLKVIGTIGVIRFAWMKGLIKGPIHEINKLLLNGFWIDEKLIEEIRKDVENK